MGELDDLLRDVDADIAASEAKTQQLRAFREHVVAWRSGQGLRVFAPTVTDAVGSPQRTAAAAPHASTAPGAAASPGAASTAAGAAANADPTALILRALSDASPDMSTSELMTRIVADGWLTAATAPRNVLRSKLSKLVDAGLIARTAVGRFRLAHPQSQLRGAQPVPGGAPSTAA